MNPIESIARAKINLALHVTGQRSDGYHLIDSLVVFADVGDRIVVAPASRSRLSVSGPMAQGVPRDQGNLVLKAATLAGITAVIHLDKHLPTAAGIGGGSADAAATLRALAQMSGRPVPGPKQILDLGADVPVCMSHEMTRMRGIGEQIERLGPAPPLSLILVNPGVELRTGTVFSGLTRRDNPPMDDPMPPQGEAGWIDWLTSQRNDLEQPAIAAAPVIGTVLNTLRSMPGCVLARMSGSGATCFAIMRDDAMRDRAADVLRDQHADWWIMPCNQASRATT